MEKDSELRLVKMSIATSSIYHGEVVVETTLRQGYGTEGRLTERK